MNDPTWMSGLGEGHHGCVRGELDTGTSWIAHHGVLEFVDYPWIERKSGGVFLSHTVSFWQKEMVCGPHGCGSEKPGKAFQN